MPSKKAKPEKQIEIVYVKHKISKEEFDAKFNFVADIADNFMIEHMAKRKEA